MEDRNIMDAQIMGICASIENQIMIDKNLYPVFASYYKAIANIEQATLSLKDKELLKQKIKEEMDTVKQNIEKYTLEHRYLKG